MYINTILKALTRHLSLLFFSGLSMMVITTAVQAATETELNNNFSDADVASPGINTGIVGDLTVGSNDADFWKFNLTAGSGFGASITTGASADINGFDPIIVLFMQDGSNYYPVAANNPDAFSTSFGFTPWLSGTYYLTVSAAGNSPQDMFNNNQYDSAFWSNESLGLGTYFDHFQNTGFSSFDYNLNLTGAVSTVPVPASIWLFTSGLLGLLGLHKRKSRA